MNIFKRILGNKENREQEPLIVEQKENELEDFDNLMYEEFEKMKLKVSKLETYMPERVVELREILNDLEKNIQEIEQIKTTLKIEEQEKRQSELMKAIKGEKIITSLEFDGTSSIIEKEMQLELYFQSKKEVFNTKYNIINQEYLMKCVENFYKRIDKVIYLEDAKKYEQYGEKNILEDFKEYYEQLKEQQNKFTGIQKNIFISKLKEVNYKLKILEILQSGVYSNVITQEWLKNRSRTDKIIENRLLLSDIRRIKIEYDKLKRIAEEKGFDLTNEKLEKIYYIEEKINTEALEEAENISEETIIEIINILNTIRDYKINLDKKLYDAKVDKDDEEETERLNEYRKKENKIREKLIEIDNEDYDNVKSYKKILEYQKDILKEEGLIDKKILFKNGNVEIIPIEKNRIPIIIDSAKENGISNYRICLDKNKAYLIKSETEKIEHSYSGFSVETNNKFTVKGEGIYSRATSSYLVNKFGLEVYNAKDINSFWGDYFILNAKQERKLKELLQEYRVNTNIDNIKFSLEVPYTRPILTILNELKNNDIEYNILPPMDDHKEQTIRIYIDRKYIEKYKTEVHNQISNTEKGIITICDDEVDIAEFLLDDCKYVENLYTNPKVLDNEKKK